jgi:hypothetical protein
MDIKTTFEQEVNVELLQAIKIFMDDLSNITENKNFIDFHTIVKRVDETKVKSYLTLVSGFKVFFDTNKEILINNDFEHLVDPNISYISNNGTFTFNFLNAFQMAESSEQEVIKDHLNLIWNLFESKEEKYLNYIIQNGSDSADIIKMCIEFKSKNLNLSRFIKVVCNYIRKRLLLEPNENISNMLDKVENIDVDNFNNVTEIFELANTLNLGQVISNLFLNNLSQPGQFLDLFAVTNTNSELTDIPINDLTLTDKDKKIDEDKTDESS